MPRLFTALEIPRDAALSLSLLRGGLPGARWIDVENYHLTLHVMGDLDPRTADEVVGALDGINRSAFQVTLSAMGSFGSRKPHSIWAGVAPSAELLALQGEISRICQRIGIQPDPRRPDPRKFVPHVTIARLRNARLDDVVDYLGCRGNFRAMPFTVGRFVVMSSRDSVGGGPYILEEAYDLNCRAPAAMPRNSAVQPLRPV